MKVLLLNQSFYPDPVATAQHTTDLALYLKEAGCEVKVLCGRRAYDNRSLLYPARDEYGGIEIRRIYYTGLGKKTFLTRLIDAVVFELALVWRLLWTPAQDVVIGFTSPPLIGVLGVAFCWIKGGHYVNWLMDMHPDTAVEVGYLKRDSFLFKMLTRAFEFSLRHSAHIIVLDRWMKERVLAHGAKSGQIAIIPPWPVTAEEKTMEPVPESENPFRRLHRLEGKFIVLYSGNHSIAHPLDTLLAAARGLRERKDILFLFIGSGLRVQDVRGYVKQHELTNVLQLPYQPRELLNQSLSSANLHVVVMGSTMSGLVHTSKIHGALATGKPYVFIGPKRSHVGDLLDECPFGFHVEHGEVKKLKEIILKAKQLPHEQLAQFRINNMAYVNQHYSARKSLDNFAREVLKICPPEWEVSAISTSPPARVTTLVS